MTTTNIEERLSAVERELAELKSRIMIPTTSPNHWIEKVAGTFSSPDAKAALDEAMSYGRKWRCAQQATLSKRKASEK